MLEGWRPGSVVWDGVVIVGDPPDFASTLAAATQGDERAFGQLFRLTQPRLLRYFRTLGPDRAEDLAAETWMHVARGLSAFEGGELGFRAWVFAIARSRRVDRLRAAGREPEFVTLTAVGEGDLPAEPSAEDVVVERLATERALRLIASLSPGEAEVITLRLVAGLDVAHTAAVLGRRRATVRVLAHRGLRKLARALSDGTPVGTSHARVKGGGR